MSLHVIATILDSPFSFLGYGKEVAVELAGYKMGTYLRRPSTLVLLKVSNSGANSNSVTDGYDFDLRLIEHSPRKAGQNTSRKRGVKATAPHPKEVKGAHVYDRQDEDSLLSIASKMTGEMSKHPTLDLVIPPAPVHEEDGPSQIEKKPAPSPAHPPLPSNLPLRPTPLCVVWAPSSVQTPMFQSQHAAKRRRWFKAKAAETDQLPAGVDAGFQATDSTSWKADDNYQIHTRQSSDGVRFYIRGPAKKQTGIPPVLLIGVIVSHATPAQLKVFPTARSVFRYVTIRKSLAVPTIGIHDEFLPTCAKSGCTPASCREFGREHLTDAMWRTLLGSDQTPFSAGAVSAVIPLSVSLSTQSWAFRRP